VTRRQLFGTTAVAAVTAATPVAYGVRAQTDYRNFHQVEPGRLYRSGQLTPAGFARILREYRIGTVFSLRDTRDGEGVSVDQWEEDLCRTVGVTYYRQPPADWSPVDGVIPGDQNVAQFLSVLRDPHTRFPVLVHCFAGIHRTGVHCAVYRIEFDGWSGGEAMDELRTIGTSRTTFAPNLVQYVVGYKRGRL
jgi:tyrosine-protein phosphatase SIW14